MSLDYEYNGEKLIPIDDPMEWGDKEDFKVAMHRYGIDAIGQPLGEEFGGRVEVFGPAKEGTPYKWLVSCSSYDGFTLVWCRDFPEMQKYLVSIAPLMTAQLLESIRQAVDDARKWVFCPEDGILAEHIAEVTRRNKARLASYRKSQSTK